MKAAALVFVLLIAVFPVNAQMGFDIFRIPTTECCSEELQKLKVETKEPRIQNIPITVKVVQTPKSKTTARAFNFPSPVIPGGHDIYITLKLREALNPDERFAVFAHELGHIVNPNNKPDDLQSEYFADEFSIAMLRKGHRDPAVILRALTKVSGLSPFATKKDKARIGKRMLHIKKIIASLNQ